jgi:4-alpha-glucanotransferase
MVSARHAGVNVPLFSLRSTRSWGIGETADIVPFAAWLDEAGFDGLMLLPLGTMPDGQNSPYSALSTLSIDPIYIAVEALQDFQRAGGLAAMSAEGREAVEAARASATVRHDLVRRAKREALGLSFGLFLREEWEQLTPRAASLAAYVARERWWLDDYALFLALAESYDFRGWRDWPEPIRDRAPRALDEVRRQLGREVLLHQYLQWVAETQWQDARAAARLHGVHVVGDLPFVAGAESPEVWARLEEFRLDVSAGVPPDAFSPTGQDWGLPTYRWDVIRETGYAWMRQRGRRMASLYDGLRVDHVIGLYRTYGRPAEGEPFFTPGEEPDQIAQGEAVLQALGESGLSLIAEDLGVVPDFLRPSLERLGIPGCKVMRWERDWHVPGAPFFDPTTYPARSAAMTGTHDTEPLCVWWLELPIDDREVLLALPDLASAGLSAEDPWTPALRDALISLALTSGASQVFLPIQDLFGWPERVNTPGTVTEWNWTWCLPWPVDAFPAQPEARERAGDLRRLMERTGRVFYTRSARPAGAEPK